MTGRKFPYLLSSAWGVCIEAVGDFLERIIPTMTPIMAGISQPNPSEANGKRYTIVQLFGKSALHKVITTLVAAVIPTAHGHTF